MQLNLNSNGVVIWTNKLEKLNKIAFPNAIRGALNSLAFDVKKDSMPKEANKTFVNRDKRFFKANSRVEMARGNSIRTMESKVGFLATGKTKNNKAVDELEQQEFGGTIKNREFIPTNTARTAKNSKRKVSRKNRLSSIKNIIRTKDIKGKTNGQKFIKAVLKAGKGGFVMTDKSILSVRSILKKKSGWKFKLQTIYTFKKGRSVKISPTHFMQKASDRSAKRADEFYVKEAKRQIKKHLG